MNTTKKLMTLLLALILPASVFALRPYSYTNYEFEVDGIYYKIVDNEACVTFQEYRSGMHLSDYHGDVIIPATVTYQDMTYPVTTIDYYAFNYCQGLTSITIPESITTIKECAFYLCSRLACVNLLTSTVVIEKYAFSMCSALTTITCPSTMPPAMYYEECFDSPHYETATLHVPASAVGSYRNAPVWKKFVHINGDAGGEAMAFDLEADGIYYVLNKKDATATVVNYSNSNVFIYGTPQYSGDIVIPEAVTDESGKTYAVTAIGNYAFSGCSDLSSVSLPNSIVTLGSHAFFLCKGLSSLSIPRSVTTVGENCFDGCTGLTELSFPETLQSIGNEAFSSCVNLADIYIPQSLTTIGQDVFRWTAWFNNQPDGIIYAGPFAYTYKGEMPMNTVIDIKPGTKYIADYAFSEQPRVVQVIMPNSITAIGTRAFYFCTGLESIEMSDAVTAIGYQAFAGCSSIQDFDFPNTLQSVGISAFGGTDWYDKQPNGLVYAGPVAYHYKGRIPDSTDFIIPDGTISLGDGLFYGSERFSLEDNYEGLLSVTIPNSVRYIGDYAFLDDCTNLQTITIGSGVEDMGNCALGWVPNLTHVTINEGVKLIGRHMFSGCPNLKEIIIPNSVEVIKYRAFAAEDVYGQTEDPACISLASVTIGNGVKAIEEFAFSGCTALTEITCLATTPPVMENENCFDNECYETATLFVPAEVVNVYRNAPAWDKFNNIRPIDSNYLPSDVNGDGETSVADANSVIDIVVMGGNGGHTRAPAYEGEIVGDVNGDGEITIADINAIIHLITTGY